MNRMKKKIFLFIMSLSFLAPIFGKFYSMYTFEKTKEVTRTPNSDLYHTSGFDDEKTLKIQILNVCVSPETRSFSGGGPYEINVELFSELMFIKTARQRRTPPYSRKHSIEYLDKTFPISDYESEISGSLSFKPYWPEKVEFKNIKDFFIKIPVRDINRSLYQAGEPYDTGFSFFPEPYQTGSDAIRAVGFVVTLKNTATKTDVISSKVAFAHPYKVIGSDLRDITAYERDGELPNIYPRIGVIKSEKFHAQYIGEAHATYKTQEFECDDKNGLEFKVEIL